MSKITLEDMVRWRQNTLFVARQIRLDENILNLLENTVMEVIPGFSGRNFYGWAHYEPPKVQVYETNPATYFPVSLREIWNQSGMDHELIGHLYNYYTGRDSQELAARNMQVEFAIYRSRINRVWQTAVIFEPFLRASQKLIGKFFYTPKEVNIS